MALKKQSKAGEGWSVPCFLPFLVCVVVVLGTLFCWSFIPSQIIFSNDNPLGAISAQWLRPPGAFFGLWDDMNVFGVAYGSLPFSLTYLVMWVLGPLLYSKFFVPLAIGFVGGSAWLCFRQLRLSPMACFLGGLAACLNSGFVSAACWGVIPQTVAFGMDFLAVAALAGMGRGRLWVSLILAGMAVGLNVMEAADIGAIFSLMIAGYVVYLSVTEAFLGGDKPAAGLVRGVVRVAMLALFAGLIAAQAIFALVSTQIQGMQGMSQDTQSKEDHWNWATQWSLPKRETLSLFVPGLFGYRMDTPQGVAHFPDWFEGGVYWGAMGRDKAWDTYFEHGSQGQTPNPNFQYLRHTGGGNYAGVLVVLVAVWAAVQAFRRKDTVYSRQQQTLVWFWAGTALIALLLAFGRHAPFYRLLYALPYFSTIRNPTKFLQVVDFSLVMLFAYGVHGLRERYLSPVEGRRATLKEWWNSAASFDKRWIVGCGVALAVSVLAWFIYSQSREDLVRYLEHVEFDTATAQSIAGFSIKQAGWFVLVLALAAGVLSVVVSGRFQGLKPSWAGLALGMVLILDLGRANLPWIVYLDYKEKYESNEVIDFLARQPYEHRVSIEPPWIMPVFRSAFNNQDQANQLAAGVDYLQNLYSIEWAQHLFLYYGIQSLDVIQMPRVPADLAAYNSAVMWTGKPDEMYRAARNWELTNTRYFLGMTSLLPLLNQGVDANRGRFRIAATFAMEPKPGEVSPNFYDFPKWTARLATNGPFAIFEFSGALPRASLYSNWRVSTNDDATLKTLGSKDFDPAQTVLVSNPISAPDAKSAKAAAGSVAFKSYAPRRLVFQAQAAQPSVLLLNDKYDPNWKVWVDDNPARLLRCNYIMRGVEVPAGAHTVEFAYRPPVNALYISMATELLGLLLLGVSILGKPAIMTEPVVHEPALART